MWCVVCGSRLWMARSCRQPRSFPTLHRHPPGVNTMKPLTQPHGLAALPSPPPNHRCQPERAVTTRRKAHYEAPSRTMGRNPLSRSNWLKCHRPRAAELTPHSRDLVLCPKADILVSLTNPEGLPIKQLSFYVGGPHGGLTSAVMVPTSNRPPGEGPRRIEARAFARVVKAKG